MAAIHSTPKESASRKVVDNILSNLNWVTDEFDGECNVFTEGPKLEEQKKQLNGKKPDYVLYEPGTNNPIAIIETKAPGKALDEAMKQARGYAKSLDVPIVFVTDGFLYRTLDLRVNEPLFLDDEPIVELLSPKMLLEFVKSKNRIRTKDTVRYAKHQLMGVFKNADDILRDYQKIRAGFDRFTEFSNFLFLKLISEIEDRKDVRKIEDRYCWDAFASKPGNEMIDYLNDTVLHRLGKIYGDVFQKKLKTTNPVVVEKIVGMLSGVSLLDTDSDVKGDAFEYFLKNSVTVGNDLGEYFTPRHIVKLMIDFTNPRYGEKVYDPCCGTGGFLIEAYRHISRNVVQDKKTRNVLENNTIFGGECTDSARIAKMNMILAGDGHTHIACHDSLEHPVKNKYDVVLTNFPFSQNTQFANLYGLKGKDANPVFVKHIIDACKDGGRIGMVVPEGFLFEDTTSHEGIREYLLTKCKVLGVIALNEFVFRPYTGQPTAILFLEKGRPTTDSVWFFNVLDDGYENTMSKMGRPPTGKSHNDIMTLRDIWHTKPESDNSFSVPIEKIKKNSWKLSMSSYKTTDDYRGSDFLKIKDVCDVRLGRTPSRKEESYWAKNTTNKTKTYPWAKISDMKEKYIHDTEECITEKGAKESGSKIVKKGSLLFSFKLSIGKTAITKQDMFTNEAIATFLPKDDKLLTEYLYYILKYIDWTSRTQRAAKGKTLNKKIIESTYIRVPSIEEQKRFIEEMAKFENQMIEAEEEKKRMEKRVYSLQEKMKSMGNSFITENAT